MKITEVYSLPNCQQCEATKIALTMKGKEFKEFNLMEEPEAMARFKAAGFMSAPIVVTENLTWSGFNFEEIDKL